MKTLHDLTADKLESDPSLLELALENIDRWLQNGHTAGKRLEEWRQLIERAQTCPTEFQRLLGILRDRSEQTQRWRDFSPFAGVLSALERREAESLCAYHF